MTPFVQTITDLLSFGTLLCGFFAVFLLFVLITPRKEERDFARQAADFFGTHAFLFAGVIAATATLGSLFYSDVAGWIPCNLCWWQRIFLYPQVIVLAATAFIKDRHIKAFCLTFSIIGAVISAYNSYLQFGGNPLVPCAAIGASTTECTFRYFLEFGYVTIPMMALTTFVLIILLMLLKKNRG